MARRPRHKGHGAVIRRLQAGDHAQQGGLATAGRSDDLTFHHDDPQAGIVQGNMAPSPPRLVGLGNAFQVNFTTRRLEGLAMHHSPPAMVSILLTSTSCITRLKSSNCWHTFSHVQLATSAMKRYLPTTAKAMRCTL